ncbi:UbiD family decarboxylase, partial [Thermodesulfobacteriota bacterium]
INKNTELHPLVRCQFRGLPDKQRRAFFFENVTDTKGKKYNMPVLVGGLAGSREVYATGLQCEVNEIIDKWDYATANPIESVIVNDARAQEVVLTDDEVHGLEGGFSRFPVPISTPGWDNAPYTTCSHFITQDPETGQRNMGNYRGMIKAPDRVGLYTMYGQHISLHWDKARETGTPLEVALVVGAPPVVSYASVTKLPTDVDEIAVAGGLAGEPIPTVRCKTVDIYVPADAEIVFEGHIPPDYFELEGPFGESNGHVHPRSYSMFMDVNCITHRKDAIWTSFLSQLTPSESSTMRRLSSEALYYKHLRHALGIKAVMKLINWEPLVNLRKVMIIQMKNAKSEEVWRALYGAATFIPVAGKLIVAVDEDIDPEDADMVFWAVGLRTVPHRDVQIMRGVDKGHAPPYGGVALPEEVGEAIYHGKGDDSILLIDATLKQPFPPVALPKKEYMENAVAIWNELELPTLSLKKPWYGYSLGDWNAELEEEAEIAVKGDYYITGEKLKNRRKKTSD